ncbi:MAG TPA: heavy metal-associated domain-containing protein, partial [Savagea sp.]
MKQTFAVQGMTCAACALTIEQALQSLDGVNEAIVHPTHETVTIDYDPTLVSFQMIREAVERAG